MKKGQLKCALVLCCLGVCISICGSSTCSHAQCRYDYTSATADCTSLSLDCIPGNYPDALIMDLSHNNISRLAPGDFDGTFRRLEELYLDFNNISNVTSLLGSNELGRLLKLSVKNNIISDLPSVCQLGSLTSLSVDYNLIIGRLGIPKCNALESFSADFNLITRVYSNVIGATSLYMISLQFNQIQSFVIDSSSPLNLLLLDHNKISYFQIYSVVSVTLGLISVSHNQVRNLLLYNTSTTELNSNSNGLNDFNGHGIYDILNGQYIRNKRPIKKLDISNNSFDSLVQPVWAEALQVLNADTNQLANLSSTTLSGFANLTELHVADNHLLYISPNALSQLSKLLSLYLDDNALTSLFGGVFSNQSNLVELSITNNLLTMLHPDYFMGLVSLERLHLAGNQLTSVNSQMFQFMPQILAIDLSRNELQLVDLGDCAVDLTNLHNLSLANNMIRDAASVLGYCDNLQLLDLSLNLIQVVLALSGRNQALSKLELEGNPLQCDCRLTGLRDWLSRNPPYFEPRCEGPVHKGSVITELDIVDLSCDPPKAMVEQKNVAVVVGQTATLVCKATGIPAPQITWISPNGTEITDEWQGRLVITHGHILHITSVEKSDQGIFTCVAENVMGNVDSAAVNVTVTNHTSEDTKLSPLLVFVFPTVFVTTTVTLAVVVLIICLRRCCQKSVEAENLTHQSKTSDLKVGFRKGVRKGDTTQPDRGYENQVKGHSKAGDVLGGAGNPSHQRYQNVACTGEENNGIETEYKPVVVLP